MKNTPEYLSAKQNFALYYQQRMLPILQKIEKERVKHLRIFLIMLPLVAIWFVYVLMNNNLTENEARGDYNAILGPLGVVIVLLLSWPMLSYYKKSKEGILPLLAGFFGQIDYEYQSGLSKETLSESQLIKSYDKLEIDDSFTGMYENTTVNITEYKLYKLRVSVSDKGAEGRTHYNKIGGGILFYAKMNKSFAGQTLVVKDKGFFNRFSCPKKKKRISLESPEFEKKFEVYGNNQVESRYILTPVMMEYMLELTKNFSNIEFSFFKEHVLINITTSENMFECSSFFRSLLNQRRIEKSFDELYLLFAIIKTLRLNKQILF